MDFLNILLVFCIAFIFQTLAATFNYDSLGSDWTGTCSTGTKQSPIELTLTSATVNTSLGSFTLTNYDQSNKYGNLKNSGYSLQVDMADTTVTISGGGLASGDYTLAQYHIHWGNTSSTGSEHTIDGTQYPLEVHFVHYLTSHGNLSTAVANADGLAVLGFMFQMDANDNTALNFFVDSITSVANKDQTTALGSEPSINSILTTVDLTKFVRYSGSLTTPTCDEVVQWTVFTDKIKISETQMNKIRAANQDTSGTTPIGRNYRAVQNLNSRTVQISYNPNRSQTIVASSTLLFVVIFNIFV